MTTKKELSAYFRRMGKRGAKARLTKMTPEQRSQVARTAAAASAVVRAANATAKRKLEGKKKG